MALHKFINLTHKFINLTRSI